jgi:hypothetical protein
MLGSEESKKVREVSLVLLLRNQVGDIGPGHASATKA